MPKTSVSPLATRNSTSPYCTPFRSWTAKLTRSIPLSLSSPGLTRRSRHGGASRQRDGRVKPGDDSPKTGSSRHHAAAAGGIGEVRVRDRDVFVPSVAHLAQIDVLHDVVGLREADRPARAVDLRALHRGDHLVAGAGVAADGREADIEERGRVVALHGVDVAVEVGPFLERFEERL